MEPCAPAASPETGALVLVEKPAEGIPRLAIERLDDVLAHGTSFPGRPYGSMMPRRSPLSCSSRSGATADAAIGTRTPHPPPGQPAAALPRFPAGAGRGRGDRPGLPLSASQPPGP